MLEVPLHPFRYRLGGRQIEKHAEEKGPLQQAKQHPAYPVYPPKQHDLENNGKQMPEKKEK